MPQPKNWQRNLNIPPVKIKFSLWENLPTGEVRTIPGKVQKETGINVYAGKTFELRGIVH